MYDLFSPWSIDRDFYLARAGKPPQHVLDLGCGTGLLCEAYAAQGHGVTGVDPTGAVLAVARMIYWPDRCGLGDDPGAEAIVDRALSDKPIEL